MNATANSALSTRRRIPFCCPSRLSIIASSAPGSVIRLFATRLGGHTVTFSSGDFYPATGSLFVAGSVRAVIGDQRADVVLATGIPGALGGAYQVDVRIPDTLSPGEHTVRITVNGFPPAESQRQPPVVFVK